MIRTFEVKFSITHEQHSVTETFLIDADMMDKLIKILYRKQATPAISASDYTDQLLQGGKKHKP